MEPRVLVVHYSSTGHVHRMAEAVASGARAEGADVRLRRVSELAPPAAIASNPAWAAHAAEVAELPVAAHDDLRWADAYASKGRGADLDVVLRAATYQGARLARYAGVLRAMRAAAELVEV